MKAKLVVEEDYVQSARKQTMRTVTIVFDVVVRSISREGVKRDRVRETEDGCHRGTGSSQ